MASSSEPGNRSQQVQRTSERILRRLRSSATASQQNKSNICHREPFPKALFTPVWEPKAFGPVLQDSDILSGMSATFF